MGGRDVLVMLAVTQFVDSDMGEPLPAILLGVLHARASCERTWTASRSRVGSEPLGPQMFV